MDRRIAHCYTDENIVLGERERPIERAKLMRLVFEAADATNWPLTSAQSEETPESVLRCIILYCLVADLCSSQEIVEACGTHPAVHYLSANHRPDWEAVHHYRRRNMQALKQAVAQILRTIGDPTGFVRSLPFLPRYDSQVRSNNRLRHSVREILPRWFGKRSSVNHQRRGICQGGSLSERKRARSPISIFSVVLTQAVTVSKRSSDGLGIPKTTHSLTSGCFRKAASMVSGATFLPATLMRSEARPRRHIFPPLISARSAVSKRGARRLEWETGQ
jgi:hypothetical protein